MVYAAVKCCPVTGGIEGFRLRRRSVNGPPGFVAAIEFKAVPGKTRLFGHAERRRGRRGHVVSREDRARAAADRMGIRPDAAEVSTDSQMSEACAVHGDGRGEVSRKIGGDALGMIAASKKVVSAEYHRPYETHARMEPINATVSVTSIASMSGRRRRISPSH